MDDANHHGDVPNVSSVDSARSQAFQAVAELTCLSSVNSKNTYGTCLTLFARHLQTHGSGNLWTATGDQASEWLQQRATRVQQKTLDLDRQALNAWYARRGLPFKAVRADYRSRMSPSKRARSIIYTEAQIAAIATAQTVHNSLATRLIAEAGLLRSEVSTIGRVDEQPPSKFPWRRDLFTGRPDAAMRYTVIGIGGLSGKLVREIAVSRTTSVELEVARHDQSRANRMPRYDVGHGAAWSHSFISASRRRLGWSLEPRSLRHAYVLNRMEALQSGGYRYDEALEVIAQEVGLLRARTIERYLPRPPKAKK